jgi:hypothetical protein
MSDPAVTEVANKLAVECLAAQKEVCEDRLFMKVGEVVGASSQTVEEAFLTAIRTRMAEIQGRDFLLKKIKAHRADKAE